MQAHIRNIVFECPDGPALAAFYGELLGMRVVRTDWLVIADDDSGLPRLAFDEVADYRRPTWPDPEHPQQLHLDIVVDDAVTAEAMVLRLGATRLPAMGGDCPVFADPAGHPFCLCAGGSARTATDSAPTGRIGTVVFDGTDPRALAAFYSDLFGGLQHIGPEYDDWVTIGTEDGTLPRLAFTAVQDHRPPRWPDPACPQQLHLDLEVDDPDAADELALRLSASRLPAMGGSAPVYADPAGHPFCLVPPIKIELRRYYQGEWEPWTQMLASIDPTLTRVPGVCGDWTLHDVVGHVQAYARFRLAHARGAFTGTAPTRAQVDGGRDAWPEDVENTTDARNEAIRTAGLSLTWQQLRDECAWLRTETLQWIDGLADEQISELIGWVNFWEPPFRDDPNNVEGLMVRRVRDVPGAVDAVHLWEFVAPNDDSQHHLGEHLGQIRGWLAAIAESTAR